MNGPEYYLYESNIFMNQLSSGESNNEYKISDSLVIL
jgi:hypothetical protein